MLVSTRGRYALRVMLELAQHGRDCYTALSSIASEQGISGKYLESIISTLSKGGLVEGVRGKGGGYRLTRPPEDYSVGEILRLAEGSLAPVKVQTANTATASTSTTAAVRRVAGRATRAAMRSFRSEPLMEVAQRIRPLRRSARPTRVRP